MYSFEKLEPRILLSADLFPLADGSHAVGAPEDLVAYHSVLTEADLQPATETTINPVAQDSTVTSTPTKSYSELVFINDDIEEPEVFLQDNNLQGEQVELVFLDSSIDGVEQITSVLSTHDSIGAIHFISHGTEGNVKLGNSWLRSDNIDSFAESISSWGDSLSEDGDILFYGCDLAANKDGQQLIEKIASLTASDIAASTNATGHAALGGDWVLEYTFGEIETDIPVSSRLQNDWVHVLAEETVGDTFDLQSYSNNTGTVTWAGDWEETGEATDPTTGNILIDNGKLTFTTADKTESLRGISRIANLSSATSAYLSFDYETIRLEDHGSILLQVRKNPGSSWTTLNSYEITADETLSEFITISNSHFSPTTEIRFISNGQDNGGSSDGVDTFIIDNLKIDYTTTAYSTPLWLTTDNHVNNGDQNGTDTWKMADLIGTGNPDLSFGDTTTGTFTLAAQLSDFTADNNINALHYVSRDVTLGSGVELYAGDILFASSDAGTTDFGNLNVQKEDIVLFRANSFGDFSAGTFQLLFDDLTGGGDEIRGITLIEQDVTVGTGAGAKNLTAGDLLFTRSGGAEDQIVYLYETGEVDPVSVLLDGHDTGVGIDQKLSGIDLIEETTTIGGVTLQSGTILLTVDNADTIGSTAVDEFDIFALEVSSVSDPTGATDIGMATASLFFNGSDVGFDNNTEKIDGFSLTVSPTPSPTITSGSFDAADKSITLSGTNFTWLGEVGDNVKENLDWSKFVWDINGDDSVTADITFTLLNFSTVEIVDDNTLLLNLTGDKTLEITGTPGYGTIAGMDTLDIAAGFFGNGSEVSTTDGLIDGPLTVLGQAPVIGGMDTGSVTEDIDPDSDTLLETTGVLTISDPDAGESSFVAETITGSYGRLTIAADGNWEYAADNNQLAIQQLAAGETLTDTLTITTADGTSHDIVITINGAEDAPALDNAIGDQTATEDVAFSFTFAANSFTDLDASDTLSYTATLDNDSPLPGWLSFEHATRTFSGTPLNDDVGILNIKVTADDGINTVSDIFVLTVSNSPDLPVIGGDDTGSVTEDIDPDNDTLLETSGVLTINDPDLGESSFVADTITGSHGTLTIDTTGQWSYQADNSQLAIQQLDTSETLTDILTVTTADGTSHDIAITINGAEDAPTLDNLIGDKTANVSVPFAFTFDANSFNDVDSSDILIYSATLDDNSALPTWLGFDSASRTFSGTPSIGDLGTLNIKITATDGTSSVSDIFVLTVDTLLHAPSITGDQTGDLVEDVDPDGDTLLEISGVLNIVDLDPGESNFVAETINGSYGSLTIDTVGNWSYEADNSQNAIQTLDAAATLTDTMSVTTADGSTSQIAITITGTDDAAVVTGTITGVVNEGNVGDAPVTATGTISVSDIDASDNPSFNDVLPVTGDNGYGSFVLNSGTWAYTLDQTAVQNLDAGDTVNDSITFTATDGTSQTVTITITGTDDAAVVTGTTTGLVTEGNLGDAPVTATGTLTITDIDASDNPSFNDVLPVTGDNGYGSFVLTSGTWTYTLDQTALQNLDAGDTVNDSITFTATDGTSQMVTITITGTDDAAVVTGTTTGLVTEGNLGDAPVTATGTISISDVDASDNPSFNDVLPVTGDNGYGSFVLNSGTWTYTLDQTAVQNLDAGDTVNDAITFTATDGTSQMVTITITGTDDAAVVTGTTTGLVTEGNLGDAPVTATGTISISDVDAGDNPSFNDVLPVTGDNGFGSFVLNSGTWTYTLDQTAVQNLDAGDTVNDSITFTATDGTSQMVQIDINGAEDAPTVDQPIPDQTVTEDTAFHFTLPTETFGDLDGSDTLTYIATLADGTPLPGWLSFNAVTGTFSGTPASGDIGTTSVMVTAFDGSSGVSDTFSLTVNMLSVTTVPEPTVINPGDPLPETDPVLPTEPPPATETTDNPKETTGDDAEDPAETTLLQIIQQDSPTYLTGDPGQPVETELPTIDFSFRSLFSSNSAQGPVQESQFATAASAFETKETSPFDIDDYNLSNLLYQPRSIVEYDLLKDSLDSFREETEHETLMEKTAVGSAIAASTGLSAGYVVWLLRSGALLSSLLSSLPAWQLADPLAILAGNRKKSDEDSDESIETIIAKSSENNSTENTIPEGNDSGIENGIAAKEDEGR